MPRLRREVGALIHWCSFCWHEVQRDAARCPDCDADLEGLSYARKLALSLRHPIRENRMIAAETLGRLRAGEFVPDLVRALESETDFYFLREVLRALATIGTPESIAALERASHHESRLVATAARELLETPATT